MKILLDEAKFDRLQMLLLWAIIGEVHRGLKEAGLGRDKLADVLVGIVFHTCCVIDGSAAIRGKSGPVIPVLTFATDATTSEVISAGQASWMHDYVHALVDEFLESRPG